MEIGCQEGLSKRPVNTNISKGPAFFARVLREPQEVLQEIDRLIETGVPVRKV